jgi:hypothetical protein
MNEGGNLKEKFKFNETNENGNNIPKPTGNSKSSTKKFIVSSTYIKISQPIVALQRTTKTKPKVQN